MDLITNVLSIKGVTNLTETIIASLCNFGTPDDPRIPTDEEKWTAIQRVASDLLKISDWTQLPDSGLSGNNLNGRGIGMICDLFKMTFKRLTALCFQPNQRRNNGSQ